MEALLLRATLLGGQECCSERLQSLVVLNLQNAELWVAGAALSIAYAMDTSEQHDGGSAKVLSAVLATGGNMLEAFKNGPLESARFFAKWPVAAKCAEVWSRQASMHSLLATSAVAQALAKVGDNFPAALLAETLNWSANGCALCDGLRSLALCRHSHPCRSQRLSDICIALEGVDDQKLVEAVQSVAGAWDGGRAGLAKAPVLCPTSASVPGSHQTDQHANAGTPTPIDLLRRVAHPDVRPPEGVSGQKCVSPGAGMVETECSSAVGTTQVAPAALVGAAPVATVTQPTAGHLAFPPPSSSPGADPFADLRMKFPPLAPTELQKKFQVLKLTPASTAQTPVMKFSAPSGTTDREGRWHWWLTLAKVGLFVKEMYAHTEYACYANCDAGPGSQGQAVVKTRGRGTVLWMSTGRVYSPNARGGLDQLLRVVFTPFDAASASSGIIRRGPVASVSPPAALDFSMTPHQ